MTECEITLLPTDQCAHCTGATLADGDWTAAIIATRFTARYDGRGACGHPIEAGDPVAYTDDVQLLCRECARR